MKLITKARKAFYKTHLFKGLASDYLKDEDAKQKKQMDKIKKQHQKELQDIAKVVKSDVLEREVPKIVEAEVTKKLEIEKLFTKKEQQRAARMRLPLNYNDWNQSDRKIGSDVPFSYLRRMSEVYPIARACINRRIRQVTQLEYSFTDREDSSLPISDEKKNKIKKFFKQPLGHKSRFREMLTIMVNDLLSIDAVCFEFEKRYNGELISLVPIDPTTIVLRVTETGGTPIPPEIAYAQYIAGEKIAEFTTDEMLYDMMGTRSYSPYGFAPLESLIIQVESALRGALFNLNYLRENNVPEGFVTLPEDVASSQEQIQQWQIWFDALMAGDHRMMHRLKFLPDGSVYTPARKPEDMSFERFELWLLQQTCAVFDVPPQEIGITYQVNKATGENQSDISREKGLLPLAGFVKEILDDIIQEEMGYEDVQFVWTNVNPVDRKEEIEVAEKEIGLGVLSGDEYRQEHGRDPIGLGHYIKTSGGVVLVKDFINGETGDDKDDKPATTTAGAEDDQQEESAKLESIDIRRWRKCVYHDLDRGMKIRRKFPSEHISKENRQIITKSLRYVTTKHQAKLLFDQFLDPKTRTSYRLLKLAKQMRAIENANIE